MAGFRLILLVVVMGGLTLLLASNWSPVLVLRFLGFETRPLPLAIWILLSTTAGAITVLFISSLYQLSNLLTPSPRQTTVNSRFTSPRAEAIRQPSEPTSRKTSQSNAQASNQESTPRKASRPLSVDEEWLQGDSQDWDLSEKFSDSYEQEYEDNYEERYTNEPAGSRNSNARTRDKQKYQSVDEAESDFESDSAYSYGYRQPKNSGVGKSESIYDADYRVIVPPYNEPETIVENNTSNDQAKSQDESPRKGQADDEWGFLDDEDEDFKK